MNLNPMAGERALAPARAAALVVTLVVWIWVASPAVAATPNPARAAAWDRLRGSMGVETMVRWSTVDDVPISIQGGSRSVRLRGWTTHRGAAVQEFFRDQADLFRLRDGVDAFSIAGERENGAIHHLRALQTYRGVRVRGGQYMVSVGADGQLRMIAGRSVPDIDCEVQPALTPERAIGAATASLGRTPGKDSVSTELAIESGDEGDRLVYEVRVQGRREPFAREVLVDARDGTIAGVRDLGFGASGCAAIWDPNPDHPLREDDFQVAEPVAGVARLEGPHVRVQHEDVDEPASSTMLPQGCFDFRFDPVTQREAFDQANVYWHVDHFLREFHGFAGMLHPVTVILHPFRCGESNTGETIGNTIWLTSEGCGYKSSTRDADIIAHETQHAVNNAFGLEGGTDLGREIYATALHESFANYFACAAHDDPIYAEYFFGPQGFANCNSDPAEYNYSRRFELGIGQLQNYLLGMIWSGALWDIRTRIGPVIDRIAFESLFYLPSAPSLHNAVDAVLQADRDHHAGVHQGEMIAAFAGRGLGPGVPGVRITGPAGIAYGDSATWTADVCCGTPPYTYQWSRVPAGSAIPEPIGTDASVTSAITGDIQLRVRIVDAAGRAVLKTLDVRLASEGTLALVIEGPRQVVAGVPSRWTARVSGQGTIPVTYRWTLQPGGFQVGGDSMSVTTSFQGQTTLQGLASVPGIGVIARVVTVDVDRPPLATILSAPLELAPESFVFLMGQASGGIQPYTWRWTRNGTGPEHLIGTSQEVMVPGDSLETDIYLTVATALGTRSDVFKRTISPQGIPLVVGMEGPDQLRFGSAGTWRAVFPDGQPPTTVYRWMRRCAEPGCNGQEGIGDGPSVTVESERDFVLALFVESGVRNSAVQRHITVGGVPTQSAVVPGPRPGPDRPALGMDKTMVRQGDGLMFSLEGPPGAPASLRLVDVAGREVAPLFEGRLANRAEPIGWRAVNLPSGIYLAQARIAGETFVRRMIVVR